MENAQNTGRKDQELRSLPDEVQRGLLYLCLLEGELELIQLSELLSSPEMVDQLLQFIPVQASSTAVWLEEDAKAEVLSYFKWSEKVKASETLANYFEGKVLNPENRADLWLMAGNKEKACMAYRQAIDLYKESQQYQATIRTCQRIMKIGAFSGKEEVEILKVLVSCYECCGELHEVIQTRTQLLGNPWIQAQKEEYAALLRALAIDHGRQGNWSYYKKLREEAALAFRESGKWEESAVEYIGLCSRCIDELNIIQGLAYSEEAIKDADQSCHMELSCKSRATQAYLMAMDGRYEEARQKAEGALQLALKNNLLQAAAYAYRRLAGTYEYASDFQQARVVYHEALHFCEIEKMDVQTQMCYSCLSWILLRLGEWKRAIEVCESLIKDPTVNNPSKSTAHCVIAIIKALRGEIRPAEKHTREGIFLAQQEQFMLMYHLLHLPMAKINELKGDREKAREWYCKIIDEWHQTREKHDVLISLMDACVFFEEQADKSALKKGLEIISMISQETGNPEALGCMAFGLGLDALNVERHASAMDYLREAQKQFETLSIPYQLLLVEVQIGKCHLAMGEIVHGRQVLSSALSKAKRLGLAPLVAKISLTIHCSSLATNPESEILTDRQLEVLHQLGKGLSNKEIAVALALSTRTVDMHMRNLFDRLGCHTRWEAVEKGRALGLL